MSTLEDGPTACCTYVDHGRGGCACPDPSHAGDPEHPYAALDSALHFHGCPTPAGRPFDCTYCQDRAASMEGNG